ncbi:MAG: sterol desaturase family protein [Chitinophagales bacterium]|nr:sterol desaturase family protein [Chitinophagales bacterium]
MFQELLDSLAKVSLTQLITTSILPVYIIFIMLLERKFPYRKGIPILREGFWIDLVWYTFIQSYFLKILIFDFIILPIDHYFDLSRLQLISHWPIALQVLFFLVTHDFYIYWFHRLQHNSKFFWRTHEAHHSVKEVDWLAGSRSHILEIIINQSIEFAPIILLGADPMVVPIKALLDAMWGIYIHSNINVKSGWLQYIINGPEMHQWHHADQKEVFYSNYATKFAFYDWIFGTAYLPNHKPLKFGLPYEYPRDYFLQHIYSVWRFDYHKLYQKQWLANVLNSRLIFLNKYSRKKTQQKIILHPSVSTPPSELAYSQEAKTA